MTRGLMRARHIVGSGFDSTHESVGVIVNGDSIEAVGPSHVLARRGEFDWELGQEDRGIICPGLTDGHHHALRPYRMGKRPPMETWLARARQRRLPPLTDQELYDQTLWGALQMLRGGTVATLDHFPLEHSREDYGVPIAVQAYKDAGVSAALCLTVNDQSHFVYEDDDTFLASLPSELASSARARYKSFDADRYFSTWDRLNERLSDRYGRIRLGFGPSGPQWCSDTLLRRLREVSSANESAPVQIHLLESRYQRIYGAKAYGGSVVTHLEQLGFFNAEHVSCAHCVWCSSSELEDLRRLGATLVHNPSSNFQLQVGIAPIVEAMALGVKVGLGCDAGGFEETLDLLTEARLSYTTQCPASWGERGLDSQQLLEAAARGSIDALGLIGRTGKLDDGSRADVVLIDDEGLQSNPFGAVGVSPSDLLLRRARTQHVRDVVVGGERIIIEGEFVAHDEAALRTRVKRSLEKYNQAIPKADDMFDELEPYIVDFYSDWAKQPPNG